MLEKMYQKQVELLLSVLPIVARSKHFALKGGTAINFFHRNMPRLSVDIDLTYITIESRDKSLQMINKEMLKIKQQILQEFSGLSVDEVKTKDTKIINKLLIKNDDAIIKIEPNHIMRGTVFPCEMHVLCEKAQDDYAVFAEMQILSTADLYAGKICAALDRQHPRDLFDVRLLLDNEDFTEELRKAFIVYLASSPRPMNELLAPNELDMMQIFQNEFVGMTDQNIRYEVLLNTRKELINLIHNTMQPEEKAFLISLKSGEPEWGLISLPNISELPAIKWKLQNIQKMPHDKRKNALAKLRDALGC